MQNLNDVPSDLTLGFTHNPAGQIVSNTRSNDAYSFTERANVNVSGTNNGLNQVTQTGSTALSYGDTRGNITGIGSSSYGYSSENMLVTAPGSTTLSYDPMLRLNEAAGGATTRFGYDGVNMIAEYDGSNVLQRRYVHGPGVDEPLVWYEGTGTSDRRWLHADERGSVIAVSDGSGNLVGTRNRYDEYGVPQGGALMGRFGYTGQTWLPEIGLYHYRARIYNPALGRFMQTDPIGYWGGMNLYAYVLNDPVNRVDPLGLGPDEQCDPQPCNDVVVIGGSRPQAQGWFAFGSTGSLQPLTVSEGGGDGGGGGDGVQPRAICRGSSTSEMIGAAREVGEATSAIGDIGQIGAAALTVVAPEFGLPLLRGAVVVSRVGDVTQGAANLADGIVNGNWGPLGNQVVGNLAGRGFVRGFEAYRGIRPRGPDGRFTRNPLTRFQEAYRRAARAAGSRAGC